MFELSFLIWNDTCNIMVGCPSCTCPSMHRFMALTLKITVSRPSCTYPCIHTTTCTRVGLLGPRCEMWTGLKTSRVATKHCVKHYAEITWCQHNLRPSPKKKKRPFFHGLGAWAGHTGQSKRETIKRRWDRWQFFLRGQRGPAPYTKRHCDALLQVGHRRCGCRSRGHVDHLRFWRRVWHGRDVLIV